MGSSYKILFRENCSWYYSRYDWYRIQGYKHLEKGKNRTAKGYHALLGDSALSEGPQYLEVTDHTNTDGALVCPLKT